jgi:hypothetical protein
MRGIEEGEQTMTELCQRYQISRETGYVWLRRYRAAGVVGLCERDRAAFRHPNQTPAEIERMVLELRQAHMRWGPRKLKRILEREEPERPWPAASTMGEMRRQPRHRPRTVARSSESWIIFARSIARCVRRKLCRKADGGRVAKHVRRAPAAADWSRRQTVGDLRGSLPVSGQAG